MAELVQSTAHSLPFSAHIFPSPDPSSLPHPLSCPSPTSLCQPPGVPSTHLSCSVKSLLPPPLGCLVKKMVGAVVCTAGPDSKSSPPASPASRHLLRAAHHLRGLPTVLALGSSSSSPPSTSQPLPAFLCSRSSARSRWRGGDQQVLRKLTAWLGVWRRASMMEGDVELYLGKKRQTEWVGT